MDAPHAARAGGDEHRRGVRVPPGRQVRARGVGYLWTATTGRAERLFITLSAVGKLTFFGLLAALWATGTLSIRAPIAGAADLVFGLLFLTWLLGGSPR